MDDTASALPKHIGFIVDGNRRWAKSHGLPAYEGHLAGYNSLKDVLIATNELGVKYMSAYVFSTENWNRSGDEVKRLLGLVLRLLTSDIPLFNKYNIKLVVAGSREGISSNIIKAIEKAEAATAENTAGVFILCFNYGGQLEIVEAVKEVITSGIPAEDMYAPEVPPIDLIVRTSGEQRLSNFMLWRAAYSELLFLDKPWPDMTNEDVTAIMEEYSRRQRRFGG
jgi:undecaprenyl diphosphate synthase